MFCTYFVVTASYWLESPRIHYAIIESSSFTAIFQGKTSLSFQGDDLFVGGKSILDSNLTLSVSILCGMPSCTSVRLPRQLCTASYV